MARITQEILAMLGGLTVDQLGRPLDDPDAIRAGIPQWHPRNDGDDDDSDDDDDADDADDDADDDDEDDDAPPAGNWKSQSRRNERRAKKERERRKAVEAELATLKAQGQTDQEQALATAKAEAKAEAEAEFQSERRQIRLENATTRIAAAGVKITVKKDGEEDRQVTLKFADPEDALVYLNKAIEDGDVDDDELFDDKGKVNTNVLTKALKDILKRKKHLQAGASEEDADDEDDDGDADQGKGGGSATITPAKAKKLAKENPAEFNRLFDEGKIPASALGG